MKEADGTFGGIWDPANPVVTVLDAGTTVTLSLFLNATIFYSVPSVVSSLTVNVDIDNGAFVSFDGSFSANGAWTNPVAGMKAPSGPDDWLIKDPKRLEDDFENVKVAALDEYEIAAVSANMAKALANVKTPEEIAAAVTERVLSIMQAKRAHELRQMRIDAIKTIPVQVGADGMPVAVAA